MAKVQQIIASGNSPLAASTIVGGLFAEGGLTAAGTTKATALALSAAANYLSITSSGKGVALPADTNQGDMIEVYNGGSNTLLVYTPIGTSQTITNGSANGGFSVATLRSAYFRRVTSTLWMVNYSA